MKSLSNQRRRQIKWKYVKRGTYTYIMVYIRRVYN